MPKNQIDIFLSLCELYKSWSWSWFTFSHVLFLFQNKHVMVEKLLQFFVAKIDANLFEAVVLENFKSSNVQNSNETNSKKKIDK